MPGMHDSAGTMGYLSTTAHLPAFAESSAGEQLVLQHLCGVCEASTSTLHQEPQRLVSWTSCLH